MLEYFTAATSAPYDFSHETRSQGGIKYPHKDTLRAHDPQTGEQAGELHYHPPKRKKAPVHVIGFGELDRERKRGAGSALLNEMERRHPGSRVVWMDDLHAKNKPKPGDPNFNANRDYGLPTDWDAHYPKLPGSIHRGIGIRLDSGEAQGIHTADRPAADQAKDLYRHVENAGSIGMHWSADPVKPHQFAFRNALDPRTDVPVVLHAQTPERKEVEVRPDVLRNKGVWPHDHHAGDAEVPVRKRRPVKLTGISWLPDVEHPEADESGWVHHTFDEPKQHYAVLADKGLFPSNLGNTLSTGVNDYFGGGHEAVLRDRAAGRGKPRRDGDGDPAAPGAGGGGAPQGGGRSEDGPVGAGQEGPRPVVLHPGAHKDLRALDKPVQKQIGSVIEALANGEEGLQTHALTEKLKGWYATKASRGHRIVHRTTDDGGVHVGYIGLHDYGKAIRRLTTRTATRLEDLPPHARAVSEAQEAVRLEHPKFTMGLPEAAEERDGALRRVLKQHGHPGHEDAFVAVHGGQRQISSIAMDPASGAVGASLHPSRADYGTMLHEAAHLLADHQSGRAFREQRPDEHVHGHGFIQHYAKVLDSTFGEKTPGGNYKSGPGDLLLNTYYGSLNRSSKTAGRVCPQCSGRGEDDQGHECGPCDGSGREPTCPCGTPVVHDPVDGWQHADGSVSHDGEHYGRSVSDLMKTAEREHHPLPERLYHVTTAVTPTLEHGLKTRSELGQQYGHGLGGGRDDTISLTSDYSTAEHLLHSLHEYHDVLNGKVTPDELIGKAKRGVGAAKPFHDFVTGGNDYHQRAKDLEGDRTTERGIHVAGEQPEGWEPKGEPIGEHHATGKPVHAEWTRPVDPDERVKARSDLYKSFTWGRQFAGGHMDPLFVQNDPVSFAKKDSGEFSLLHVRPKPGAHGIRMNDRTHGTDAGEWRALSGKDLEVTYNEGRESIEPREAVHSRPTSRIFGPTFGLDHRLFEAEHLKPEVRTAVMGRLGPVVEPLLGQSWEMYTKVYLAGSEASEWTSETLEGNGDFDTLIGIDYDHCRDVHLPLGDLDDSDITDMVNAALRTSYNASPWVAPFGGTWDLTGYVNANSYDITRIKPYAAYNISDDEWAVRPPHLPDWSIEKFPEGGENLLAEAEGYAAVVEAISKMPEPFQTQQGKSLWKHLHTDRGRAFSDEGEGWLDPGNALEKILVEWDVWPKLVEWQYGTQKTAAADPPTIKRGIVLEGHPVTGHVADDSWDPGGWDREAAHRISSGTATHHDLLKHVDLGHVGHFWYHPEHADVEGTKEFAEPVEPLAHNLDDAYDNGKVIGDVGVVLEARHPQGWHPDDNPDHGLMGNSYLPDHSHLRLHKMHYTADGETWHTLPLAEHGITAHTDGPGGKTAVKGSDHPLAPDLPQQQHDALTADSYSDHRRQTLELAKNPVPGTHIWRGELRKGDPVQSARETGVGIHWGVNPDNLVHPHGFEGESQVVYHAELEHPGEQNFGRDHPMWRGRHRSMDAEAEIRLKPGAKVKLHGVWVKDGYHPDPGHFVPRVPERMGDGWSYFPIGEHVPVAHRPTTDLIDYGDVGVKHEGVLEYFTAKWSARDLSHHNGRSTTESQLGRDLEDPFHDEAEMPSDIGYNHEEHRHDAGEALGRLGENDLEGIHRTIEKHARLPLYIATSRPEAILKHGRMKTLGELGEKTGKAQEYIDFRHEYERHVMGIEHDAPKHERPIYGVASDHADPGMSYGEYHLELKRQVRSRTTMTGGDSLNHLLHPYGLRDLADHAMRHEPERLHGLLSPPMARALGAGLPKPDYMEVQVHGGVDLDDIARIHVHGQPTERKADLMAQARKAGIETVHHPHVSYEDSWMDAKPEFRDKEMHDRQRELSEMTKRRGSREVRIKLGEDSYALYRPGMTSHDKVSVVGPSGVREMTWGALVAHSHGEVLDQLPGEGEPESRREAMLGYFTAADDDDYRMQHRPPDIDFGAPHHDVGDDVMPDLYSRPADYDHSKEPSYWDSFHHVQRTRGKPEAKVRIYRSLPAEHAHQGFRPGDWVTTSKEYARQHGKESDPKHDWPVISTMVPAKHLQTDGNDLREWGYTGPHKDMPMVSYKGGYHQEIRNDSEGWVKVVKRRAPKTADYRIQHQAPDEESGKPFHHYFGGDENEEVRIYRAAPPGVNHLHTNTWVTTGSDYAHQHAGQRDGSKWPVMSTTVPARHLYWDENDGHEFGYQGPKLESRYLEEHDQETDSLHPFRDREGVHDEEPGGQAEDSQTPRQRRRPAVRWGAGVVHLTSEEHGRAVMRPDAALTDKIADAAGKNATWHDRQNPAAQEAHGRMMAERGKGATKPMAVLLRSEEGKVGELSLRYHHEDLEPDHPYAGLEAHRFGNSHELAEPRPMEKQAMVDYFGAMA
jgi:hypothetical protein